MHMHVRECIRVYCEYRFSSMDQGLVILMCNMPWIINKVLLCVHDIIRNGVNIVPTII